MVFSGTEANKTIPYATSYHLLKKAARMISVAVVVYQESSVSLTFRILMPRYYQHCLPTVRILWQICDLS